MTIPKWLKSLCGFRSPVGRIIYPLPNASVFNKYYYKDVFFHGFDWTKWGAVVEGFRERFNEWYFSKMQSGHASYLDLCSLCALVEVFLHYTHKTIWHDSTAYKKFLRKLHPIFSKKLKNPIDVSWLNH